MLSVGAIHFDRFCANKKGGDEGSGFQYASSPLLSKSSVQKGRVYFRLLAVLPINKLCNNKGQSWTVIHCQRVACTHVHDTGCGVKLQLTDKIRVCTSSPSF